MKAKTICPVCKKEIISCCSACIERGTLVCNHDEKLGDIVIDNIIWEIVEEDPDINRKILNIPYISQHRDIKDEYWQKRACGLVCLKMVLDFHKVKTPEINQFLKIAIDKKAFGEFGWIHDKLLEIAKSYGIEAFRKEKMKDVQELKDFLNKNNPVIVSVRAKRFLEEFDGKFHQIILTGYDDKGFYYNDSDYENEEGKNLFVDINIFEKYWRRMGIFVS